MDSSHALTPTDTFASQPVVLSFWRRVAARLRGGPLISLGILGGLVFVALFADFLAPYPYSSNSRYTPEVGELRNRYRPPMWQARGKSEFILGTDQQGRDILSRLIYGSRISLKVAVAAVLVSGIIGTALGILSGYIGGNFDNIVMRGVDILFAFPGLVLAIVIAGLLGPSTANAMIAIGVVYAPAYARVARGSVLSVKAELYLEAARLVGGRGTHIVLRHILPNIMAPLIVLTTLSMSTAILTEAALSFLGLGTQPPEPSWGIMLSNGRRFMEIAPGLAIFPGLAIVIAVLGFNFLGDGLRDALDPRLKE